MNTECGIRNNTVGEMQRKINFLYIYAFSLLPSRLTPCHRLGCRLGRCFCFAEVSTGHPHPRQRKAKQLHRGEQPSSEGAKDIPRHIVERSSRKEAVSMVTYNGLFLLLSLIVSIIALVYNITKKK